MDIKRWKCVIGFRSVIVIALVAILASQARAGDTAGDDGCLRWEHVLFGPREHVGMAYDDSRNEVVLFGGAGGHLSQAHGETWVWDGEQWSRRVVPGPKPRYGQPMAFDSVRGVIVLHGGHLGYEDLEDTWEWDGASWEPRVSKGPHGWYDSMAFDRDRGRAVIWQGSRFMEWDGSVWHTVQVEAPASFSPFQYAIAYDEARKHTLIYSFDVVERDRM